MYDFSLVARVYRSAPPPVLFGDLVATYGATTRAASLVDAEAKVYCDLRDVVESEFSADELPAYRITVGTF